jgi:ABC-type dipeptide/oligopeptide/nickel transport system permease component
LQKAAYKVFFDSQYIRYMGRLVRLDMGESIHRRIPVAETLGVRFPATFELAMVSMLLAIIIGVPVGIASAARRNSVLDGISMVGSLIGVFNAHLLVGVDGDHALCCFLEVAAGWRALEHGDRSSKYHRIDFD